MRARADVVDAPRVEFVAVDDDQHTYHFRLVARGQDVGTVRVIVNEQVIGVAIGIRCRSAVDDAFAQRMVDELDQLAAVHPGLPLDVNVADPLLRHRLRGAGYTGALRAPLRRGTSVGAKDDELDALQTFLPHLDVVAHKATRRALRVEVSAPGSDARLEAGMPRRPMLVEQVAASFDTAIAIKQAFAPLADGVRRFHYRESNYAEPPSNRASGQAFGDEHVLIDTSNVYVAELLAERRGLWALRLGAPDQMPFHPQSTPTDNVVAHELWHLFDRAIMGTGDERLEFDRPLAELLGADTLEDVIAGRDPDSYDAWSLPTRELANQVSLYATTRYREATAEMFRVWWCSPGDHTPVVARFGELVEERLGRPAHPTTTATRVESA